MITRSSQRFVAYTAVGGLLVHTFFLTGYDRGSGWIVQGPDFSSLSQFSCTSSRRLYLDHGSRCRKGRRQVMIATSLMGLTFLGVILLCSSVSISVYCRIRLPVACGVAVYVAANV
jgi:hypothetical protein